MDSSYQNKLAELLEQASNLPPEEREAFVIGACQGDEDLKNELLDLLLHVDKGEELFNELDGVVPSLKIDESEKRSTPFIQEGDLFGKYKITKLLGRGGMGEVYEAFDTQLQRPVALKFLPFFHAVDPASRERFILEARAASALDHPNICTIYEIGETDAGRTFIAMAYYDGENLKQKIETGRLAFEQVMDYGIQLSSGLARAHARGIIHRDIKPANVIAMEPLEGESGSGIVKIVDFGLAKMANIQLTQTGTTMGTASYMSPEQALSDKAVDHRTDIWSLGVMMYEMLTGTRPFKGDYSQVVLYEILNNNPRPVRELNPDIPHGLEKLVMKCLEKDPASRYATANELQLELERLRIAEEGPTSVQPPAVVLRPWIGIALGIVGLLAMLYTLLQIGKLLIPTRPPQTIAVLPFVNDATASAQNQALASGLTQSLTNILARICLDNQQISVVPAEDLKFRGVTTAGEARRLFGASRVLRGSFQNLGNQTELILNLIDPDTSGARIVDTRTIQAPLGPVFQFNVINALEEMLALEIDPELRAQFNVGDRSSQGTYAHYLQGMGYLGRLDIPGNLELAIEQFDEALEIDAGYAPALAGLCEAVWKKYDLSSDNEDAEKATHNCNRADSLASGHPDMLIAQGGVYLRTGQFVRAEQSLKTAEQLEPDNAEIHRWLGRVYEEQGNVPEAQQAFEDAITLSPNYWYYHNLLGILMDTSGRPEEALPHFEQARRLVPDNHHVYISLAVVKNQLGDYEEARELLQKSVALQPGNFAYRMLGYFNFTSQLYQEAVQAYEEALVLNPNDWVTRNWLGHAYYWVNDIPRAHGAWETMIEQALPLLEVNARDDNVLVLLADAHFAMGNREAGNRYLDRLLAQSPAELLILYFVGRIYAMQDRQELALDWIEKALEQGFDPVVPDNDPWLAALRETPRYQSMRALLGGAGVNSRM